MKLTKVEKQELCDLIQETLGSATLKNYFIEGDGNHFPLVDFLSRPGETILDGKEEIDNLVEQIFFAIDENY